MQWTMGRPFGPPSLLDRLDRVRRAQARAGNSGIRRRVPARAGGLRRGGTPGRPGSGRDRGPAADALGAATGGHRRGGLLMAGVDRHGRPRPRRERSRRRSTFPEAFVGALTGRAAVGAFVGVLAGRAAVGAFVGASTGRAAAGAFVRALAA